MDIAKTWLSRKPLDNGLGLCTSQEDIAQMAGLTDILLERRVVWVSPIRSPG